MPADLTNLRPDVARVLGEAVAFHKFAVDAGLTGVALERYKARIPQDHKDVFQAFNEAVAASK